MSRPISDWPFDQPIKRQSCALVPMSISSMRSRIWLFFKVTSTLMSCDFLGMVASLLSISNIAHTGTDVNTLLTSKALWYTFILGANDERSSHVRRCRDTIVAFEMEKQEAKCIPWVLGALGRTKFYLRGVVLTTQAPGRNIGCHYSALSAMYALKEGSEKRPLIRGTKH